MTINWRAIESFIGYGRANAPVVFVGMEEGLGAASLSDDLARRSSYSPVKALEPKGTRLVPTWAPMCELMLRRQGRPISTVSKRAYQMSELGSTKGDSIMIDLLPYPKRTRRDWPSEYVQRGFAGQKEYMAEMLPKRQADLSKFMAAHPRDLIVFYGKEHAKAYRDLLPECEWRDEGVFSISKTNKGRAIIAPHFVSATFARNRTRFFDLCLN